MESEMDPKSGTQNDRLLTYLREGHTINPLIAWTRLGIYRLSGRIFDLRQLGHPITKTTKTVRNRFGEEIRVGCYKLEVRP
jgi:hypothetical protein